MGAGFAAFTTGLAGGVWTGVSVVFCAGASDLAAAASPWALVEFALSTARPRPPGMGDFFSRGGIGLRRGSLGGGCGRGSSATAVVRLRAQGKEPQAAEAEDEHENDLEGTRDLVHRYRFRQERRKGLAL